MQLIFLSGENLGDSFFMKSLVANFPLKGKSLIVTDHFGKNLSDTRFVNKRISALLSDNMVVNLAFSGEQKNMLSLSASGELLIRAEEILRQMHVLTALLLTPVASGPEGPAPVEPVRLLRALREALPVEQTFLFARNMKSPLATPGTAISGTGDIERLLALYEEERIALETAEALAPAFITSPLHFAR